MEYFLPSYVVSEFSKNCENLGFIHLANICELMFCFEKSVVRLNDMSRLKASFREEVAGVIDNFNTIGEENFTNFMRLGDELNKLCNKIQYKDYINLLAPTISQYILNLEGDEMKLYNHNYKWYLVTEEGNCLFEAHDKEAFYQACQLHYIKHWSKLRSLQYVDDDDREIFKGIKISRTSFFAEFCVWLGYQCLEYVRVTYKKYKTYYEEGKFKYYESSELEENNVLDQNITKPIRTNLTAESLSAVFYFLVKAIVPDEDVNKTNLSKIIANNFTSINKLPGETNSDSYILNAMVERKMSVKTLENVDEFLRSASRYASTLNQKLNNK